VIEGGQDCLGKTRHIRKREHCPLLAFVNGDDRRAMKTELSAM